MVCRVKNPLVSIIVLSWNGDLHIHKCIEHVLSQTYANIEVIVVDNGSTDLSLVKLKEKYTDFKYIEIGENIGFAAGMNRGIQASNGEFIIPLNQDVCLHKQYVQVCVIRITQDSSIGAIGGRVYSWIGDSLTNDLRKGEGEKTFFRKRFQGLGGIYSKEEVFVFMPSGSFPFLRKDMLEDVRNKENHYYDEDFVTGWEDSDLFFRMHLRGWNCLFIPNAYGWHVGSGSVGGKSTLLTKGHEYQIRIFRNRYNTLVKNIPLNIIFWLLPSLILTEILLVPYLIIYSPKSIKALMQAWYQTIRNLRTTIKKRNVIMGGSNVEPNYLKKYFKGF